MYNRYSNTNSEFLHKTLSSTTGNLTAKFNKSGFPLFVIAYVKMKLREPRAIAAFVWRRYENTGGHVVQSRDLLARPVHVAATTGLTVRR
jgi:hypothetical protein